MRIALRIWLAIALLWTLFTVGFFAVVSVLILRAPEFPLGITFVQTRGLPRLWITVPSFLLGVAGIILLIVRRTTGAKCLLLYSAFWTASMLFDVVERMRILVRSSLAVCLTGMCTTLPVTLAILAAFALCALWYWREGFPRLAH
jgi:hypothetical protein